MAPTWPALPPYEEWRPTRDTLHAHTQVLGKLAVTLAPPEPQLQHAALRLSARAGRLRHWDTTLGEFILDWDDARATDDPHAAALEFARSAVGHACTVCGWDPVLAASTQAFQPPPA